MPQRSSHIGLFDAKSDCGVTVPVFIRSNETPMGRKLRYTSGPNAGIQQRRRGKSRTAYYSKCYFTFSMQSCQAHLCKFCRRPGDFFVTVDESDRRRRRPACPCFLGISVIKWVYYAVILTFTVSAKHFGLEQQFAAKSVRSYRRGDHWSSADFA